MRWQDPPGVHARHDVPTCAVQLRADGSGAFPLPQQPPGELFTSPPEQLLAALNPGRASPTAPRDPFPAASPAAGSSGGGATLLNGAATHSAPGAPAIVPASAPVDVPVSAPVDVPVSVPVDVPVSAPVSGPVAPIGDFLTVDPAAEGPLPAAALNLARPQGSGPRASAAKTRGPVVHSYEGGQQLQHAAGRRRIQSQPIRGSTELRLESAVPTSLERRLRRRRVKCQKRRQLRKRRVKCQKRRQLRKRRVKCQKRRQLRKRRVKSRKRRQLRGRRVRHQLWCPQLAMPARRHPPPRMARHLAPRVNLRRLLR